MRAHKQKDTSASLLRSAGLLIGGQQSELSINVCVEISLFFFFFNHSMQV
jgi:hypothetical protein